MSPLASAGGDFLVFVLGGATCWQRSRIAPTTTGLVGVGSELAARLP